MLPIIWKKLMGKGFSLCCLFCTNKMKKSVVIFFRQSKLDNRTNRVPDLHGHVCQWWWAWSSRAPGGEHSCRWWLPWTPCLQGCYGWCRWAIATSVSAWTPPHASHLVWWLRTWCPHWIVGLPRPPQPSPGHLSHLGSPYWGHSYVERDKDHFYEKKSSNNINLS